MGPFSRSVELTAQWNEILTVGPLYPVTLDDIHAVEDSGLGDFHRVVCNLHHRLSDFIHGSSFTDGMRLIRGWRNWIWEDSLVHPYKWLRPDLVLPAPFLQCRPHLTPVWFWRAC